MSRKLGLPPAFTQYGASMGRESDAPGNFVDVPGGCRLRRVPLNDGGYDEGGAYWGHSYMRGLWWEPLYMLESEDARMFLRVRVPVYANARACAVAKCKEMGFTVKGRQS